MGTSQVTNIILGHLLSNRKFSIGIFFISLIHLTDGRLCHTSRDFNSRRTRFISSSSNFQTPGNETPKQASVGRPKIARAAEFSSSTRPRPVLVPELVPEKDPCSRGPAPKDSRPRLGYFITVRFT